MTKLLIYLFAGFLLLATIKYWLADFYYAQELPGRAVELSPNEAVYRNKLAETYADFSPQLAKKQLELSMKLSPRNIKLLKSAADIYDDIGDTGTSLEIYKDITRLAPTDAQAWYSLALTYAKLGKPNEAIDTLAKVIEMKPDYGKARELFGILHK